jgi:tRNA threonylcarbamoyladenosine biosynthesis protein TsaB
MLLAIDTATRSASVALYGPNGLAHEQTWYSANQHSREVMPAIAAMLSRQSVSPDALVAVGVASGPGSFTGLRIGVSIAKGLCLALDIPIIGVPTLDGLAYAAGDPGMPLIAVLEAGRGRLSVCPYTFRDGLPIAEGPVQIVAADDWTIDSSDPVLLIGELGADVVDRLLAQPGGEQVAIASLASSVRRAGYLAELAWNRLQSGDVDDLDTLSPTYPQAPTSGVQG